MSATPFNLSLPARGTTVQLQFATSVPSDPGAALIPVSAGVDGVELPVTALGATGLLETLEAVGATGKQGEVTRVVRDGRLVVAFGLGDSDDIDEEAVRRATGALARSLTGIERATITTEFGVRPIVEGLLLGGYTFAGVKARPEKDQPTTRIDVVGDDSAREAFDRAVIVAESTLLTRDLVNTPSNVLYPDSYATVISEVAAHSGLEVEVFDEAYLADKGFGGILSVGQGSARPPRLVHLSWHPAHATTTVALVGKGITFDTGGISLKPADKMWDMISDMGGSAAIVGAISAAARLEVPLRIDAWLPLAENMPSGSATRPGDVITHYGGITSEVLNTDAEGRLVLADAIARACEDTPDYLIDTATLTGAQMVALGSRTAGVMGTEEFRDRVAETGREVGEASWAMQLLEEHEEQLKSPVADIRNIGDSRNGGMQYAGLYLSRFVAENTQWAHIDVAGPAWNSGSPWGYTPRRATGAPVRTIVETLSALAE
ncbi:leucyl aminopeptidase [Corynebacterium timonense]|uniref:Probable cytosol aminopeptidase n=1 Tax=Corynebacterium timonense TaxID=441500 RepID=A0A1H1MGL9_9CORY|nr:leucyl aminopeptidase [Corynebacterium timonense]SDR85846.1 leucyl aminopeptidase [Corynebacterium timonense]